MFREHGIVFPPGPATIEAAVAAGADVLVVGEPVVGFAALMQVDGYPHLEQISIHADQAGQGIGRFLLAEVIRVADPGLTLLTFRDVPWNGPWHARHGFVPFPEPGWGPDLRAHWNSEIGAGIHALGPRLAMRYP
jgi:GNAT superfamily N-acetyltransferase